MEKEDVKPFLKKYVKLEKYNSFVLEGTIDKISEDAIVFTTRQATSVIDIKTISSIVMKHGGGC